MGGSFAGPGRPARFLTEAEISGPGDTRYMRRGNNGGDIADKAAFYRTIGPGSRVITTTGTITQADWGKTLFFESATAMSITPDLPATLGDGFWCRFKNTNFGLVTLVGAIDGLTNAIVPRYDSGVLVSNGSYIFTLERSPHVLLEAGVISSGVANKDFVIPDGFDTIELEYQGHRAASDGNAMGMRVSIDGSTYATSAYYYGGGYGLTVAPGALDTASGAGGAGYLAIGGNTESDSTGGGSGRVTLYTGPTTGYRRAIWQASNMLSDGRGIFTFGGGLYASNAVWTNFRLLSVSGANINNLTYSVMGRRRFTN